ncbi:PREDICTED: uricase-like [Priapulus caudatus]|uniref:Uricase n=1 Tax=Priapulus caudatus TaxID=37621 RepID=A0ABM1E9J3_PRICU|nr:PREDICTED: uricase-like [Priapulus caudatus]XP_014668864.1 PREDICTED: uricase-like [Priapulus caudatus]XP_014668865.1 PREDICTED: uricase-like [Priapulus caudatus]
MAEADMVFVNTEYGKDYVRLLHVRREGPLHHTREIEVNTTLTLACQKDYTHADNSDIIATDTQKNTVYILAKQRGIHNIETFALILSNHFLDKYRHVTRVHIHIKEAPWRRMEVKGRPHNHAFISTNDGTRFCDVAHKRYETPVVSAGITDLKLMKTTQSAFTNFIRDEYCSLPEMNDRVFCTIVTAKWQYSRSAGFCFDRAWEVVKSSILEEFGGPSDTGVFSPSVQHTLYLTIKTAMAKVQEIDLMEIELPNVHAYNVDYTKFPALNFKGSVNEVFMPVDKPSGNIKATLARAKKAKL